MQFLVVSTCSLLQFSVVKNATGHNVLIQFVGSAVTTIKIKILEGILQYFRACDKEINPPDLLIKKEHQSYCKFFP